MSGVGFTGSRTGMTSAQATTLSIRLAVAHVDDGHDEFHQGDCIGSDATATAIAQRVGFLIVCHPPTDPSRRAWLPADRWVPALPFLDRNHAIVDESAVLYATPDRPETLRSGTWSTIRYARRTGREVVVVMPDGSVTG